MIRDMNINIFVNVYPVSEQAAIFDSMISECNKRNGLHLHAFLWPVADTAVKFRL